MLQQMKEEMRAEIEAVEGKLKMAEQEAAFTMSKLEAVEKEANAMKSKVEMDAIKLEFLETSMTTLTASLPSSLSQAVRDLPVLTTCGYRGHWTTPSSTITYDRLISDYNNADRPGGADGVLDISTGVFYCACPGHYTVTYSGEARLDTGEYAVVSVYKNYADMGDGGRWTSYYGGPGLAWDQGSRTLVSSLSLLPLTACCR